MMGECRSLWRERGVLVWLEEDQELSGGRPRVTERASTSWR